LAISPIKFASPIIHLRFRSDFAFSEFTHVFAHCYLFGSEIKVHFLSPIDGLARFAPPSVLLANFAYEGVGIDLSLLQTTRVVDVNRFPLGEVINGCGACFAVTVAGLFNTTKGN
jgi:hypothetical protein